MTAVPNPPFMASRAFAAHCYVLTKAWSPEMEFLSGPHFWLQTRQVQSAEVARTAIAANIASGQRVAYLIGLGLGRPDIGPVRLIEVADVAEALAIHAAATGAEPRCVALLTHALALMAGRNDIIRYAGEADAIMLRCLASEGDGECGAKSRLETKPSERLADLEGSIEWLVISMLDVLSAAMKERR